MANSFSADRAPCGLLLDSDADSDSDWAWTWILSFGMMNSLQHNLIGFLCAGKKLMVIFESVQAKSNFYHSYSILHQKSPLSVKGNGHFSLAKPKWGWFA